MRVIQAILVVSVLAAWPAPRGLAQPTVRLHSSAQVAAAEVRLSDLAVVSGLDESAGRVVVANLPVGGTYRDVTLRDLESALRAGGVNPVPIHFSGSASCRVSREGAAPPPSAAPVATIATDAGSASADKAGPAEAPAGETPATQPASEPTLGQRVLDQLATQLGAPPSAITLTFDRLSARTAEKVVPAQMSLTSTDRNRLGRRHWRAEAVEGDRRYRYYLTAEVAVRRVVVVAGRDIAAGAAIRGEDLRTVEQDDAGSGERITDLATAAGQQATRAIAAGEPLSLSDLRSPVLVKRGGLAAVHSRSGAWALKVTARALSDGRAGDRVQFENIASGQRLWGRVTAAGSAEILATEAEK